MAVKNGWNWVFGHYQWMSFSASSGDVTYVKSSASPGMGININQTEGSDSVSDDNGNLLFYTNGVTVWNSSGNTITTGLNGSNNSMQSSTIIRSPYSASSYYVFTTGNWSDPAQTIDYSIIDFGIDPTGTTVSLNVSLTGGSNYDENLTSTRHSNGTDFWIVARRRNSTYFDAWSSVTSGMSDNIVSSDIGHEFNGANRYGQIKMSPSGDRIGFAIGGTIGSGFNPVIAVYDFDISTGVVSNPTVLVGSGTTYNFTFTGAVTQDLSALNTISCDFSPDGKFLYASLGDSAPNNNRNIVQFNLENLGTYPSASGDTVVPDTNARIILDPSDTQFGGSGGIWNGGWMYGIHRGPNQRLYFLRSKSVGFLSQPIGVYEIKYPNNLVSSPTSIGVNEIYYGGFGPDLAMPNISGPSLPPQPQCSATTYCINATDSYLDDTYTETGTTFDSHQVWVGDTNGLFIYYSTGNTQWCLSNTLGGDCILFGKSPCVSLCPDLCEHFFFEGICPTPTPTPPYNCDVLDFNALFDCDVTPTPTPSPTPTPTSPLGPTPTPNPCSDVAVDAIIMTITPTPTPANCYCPEGYTLSGDSCYKETITATTFNGVSAFTVGIGYYLKNGWARTIMGTCFVEDVTNKPWPIAWGSGSPTGQVGPYSGVSYMVDYSGNYLTHTSIGSGTTYSSPEAFNGPYSEYTTSSEVLAGSPLKPNPNIIWGGGINGGIGFGQIEYNDLGGGISNGGRDNNCAPSCPVSATTQEPYIAIGPLMRSGVWATPYGTNTANNQYIGFSKCLNLTETKTYRLGWIADDDVKISINGNLLYDLQTYFPVLGPGPSLGQFGGYQGYTVVGITLNAGPNYIEASGINLGGGPVGFTVELYDATEEELKAIRYESELSAVTVWSTQQEVGNTFPLGDTNGYSCPIGYALDTCVDPPYSCSLLETTNPICSPPEPTPTPTLTRPCNFSGDVTFNTVNSGLECSTGKQFQDCYNGMIYTTNSSVTTPSGDTLSKFMVFLSVVDGVSRCISYLGTTSTVSGVNNIQLISGPLGYSNLNGCSSCTPIVPTPTPSPIPPTPTSTPTPTPTPTPSPTPPQVPG